MLYGYDAWIVGLKGDRLPKIIFKRDFEGCNRIDYVYKVNVYTEFEKKLYIT